MTQHDDNRDVNTNPRHHHIFPSDVTLLDAALIGLCFSLLGIVEEGLNLNNMSPNFSHDGDVEEDQCDTRKKNIEGAVEDDGIIRDVRAGVSEFTYCK